LNRKDCALRADLEQLPELPSEPHPFFLLPERRVKISLPGRATPVELGYREIGAGKPVLCLHGLWSSAYLFRHLLAPLSTGHRLILPELMNLPGPPGEPLDYRPEALAVLIGELGRALSLASPLVVAHAESGLAALLLGLESPQSLSGLVAIGVAIRLPFARRVRGRVLAHRFMTERWARQGFRRPQQAAIAALDYTHRTWLCRQEIRHLSGSWAVLPRARARAQILAQTLSIAYRAKFLERIAERAERPAEFPVPLKLVCGAKDRLATREQGEALYRMFPGAELLVADDSRGPVIVEKPQWMAQIIAAAANR
jgi:pimeloyl-ACP methyl ester carboxylesterase